MARYHAQGCAVLCWAGLGWAVLAGQPCTTMRVRTEPRVERECLSISSCISLTLLEGTKGALGKGTVQKIGMRVHLPMTIQ